MQTNLIQDVWMDCLQILVPARGIVHVGAGNGHAAVRYANWSIDTVLLIEANRDWQDCLATTVRGHPGWNMHTTLVSDTSQEVDFFVASNPSESGVLQPDVFSEIWQNLRTREQRRLNAVTLDSVFAASNGTSKINWAVVDCVPALPVLRGAAQCLERWDIVIARVIIGDSSARIIEVAAKSRVDEFLSSHGYSCVAYQEELNPALGKAFYVRNWHRIFNEKLAYERRLAPADRMREEQLSVALDTQTALAVERQTKLDQLASDYEERAAEISRAAEKLTAQMEDLERQVAQRKQEGDDIRGLLNEREIQLSELTRMYNELAHVTQDRLTQIDRLAKTHAEQVADFSAEKERMAVQVEALESQVAQRTQERNDARELLNERDVRLTELTRMHDESARVSHERLAQLDQLAKVHEERAADFSRATEKLTSQIEDLQGQIAHRTQESNDTRVLLNEREIQLNEITRAHAEQNRLAAARLAQIEKSIATEAALQRELLEARQSASLCVKLQSLREADLRDLQARYEESLSIRERQHQMLAKLSERLSVASGYFHQLAASRAALERDVEENFRVNPNSHPNDSPMLDRGSDSRSKSKRHSRPLSNVNRQTSLAKSTTKPSSKRKRRG